jgi:acetyl esterase
METIMAVDPAVQTVLDGLAGSGVGDVVSMSPADLRGLFETFGAMGRMPPVPAATTDRSVPGPAGDIAVRVYRPASSSSAGPLPLVVYFHGGGWVIGSIDSHDPICHQLATGVPAVVVSVDYRLAPEAPFPAAVDDALAATAWVADHAGELGGDPRRLVVAGDSAGGNLAAVVSHKARDAGGPALAYQLLIYPATDLMRSMASHTENGEGYFLTTGAMDWFIGHYLGDGDPRQADASPLFDPDLTGLPPGLVITAEYDPLRDEGEAYAWLVAEAGGKVTDVRYDGMIHGFFGMDAIVPAAADAVDRTIATLREALNES